MATKKPRKVKATIDRPRVDLAALDQDMLARAKRALAATFQAIAPDVFAMEEASVTMTRADVVECVGAAGFVGGYPEMYGNDKDAVKWLDGQPDEVREAICTEAFPHAKYAM